MVVFALSNYNESYIKYFYSSNTIDIVCVRISYLLLSFARKRLLKVFWKSSNLAQRLNSFWMWWFSLTSSNGAKNTQNVLLRKSSLLLGLRYSKIRSCFATILSWPSVWVANVSSKFVAVLTCHYLNFYRFFNAQEWLQEDNRRVAEARWQDYS